MPNVNQVRALSRVEGSLEDAQSLWVDELFWRVPIDDARSVTFVVDFVALAGEAAEAYRARRRQTQESATADPNEQAAAILAGRMRVEDVDEGLSLPKRFWIEDYVTQVGQGPTADRENEHLYRMDVGTMLLRKLWARELAALAEGRPLKAGSTAAALADISEAGKDGRGAH